MIETVLVFDKEGKTICFHEPPGSTRGSIPDSRDLWNVLWGNRENLGGVAHTHPWDGEAWPSQTDVTTFRAIELGLGKNLLWPVVTFTDMKTYVFNPVTEAYCQAGFVTFKIEGIAELRARSR